MPGGMPLGWEICNGRNLGATGGTGTGTVLTAGATANVKGSYTQMIAATSGDTSFVSIYLAGSDTSNSTGCGIDIAIGPAGSEKVIVSNLMCSGSYGTTSTSIALPLSIPAGSRVSARMQSNIASEANFDVTMCLFDGASTMIEGYSGVDALGYNAATSFGTTLTAGSPAGILGSYSQITSATTRDYAGLFAVFDTNGGNLYNSVRFLIDIAIGASGSEQVIIPENVYFLTNGSIFYPIPVPAGTRIAARCSSPSGAFSMGCTVYGAFQ